jgi:hypothetical protein
VNRQTATETHQQMSASPLLNGILQRKCDCGQHTVAGGECAECGEERKKRLLTSRNNFDPAPTRSHAAPPIVHEVLNSPGQPLDAATRAFFEPRFGHDFTRVRLHTDGRAAESARAVNALAYTVGNEIVFGAGQLSAPGSDLVLAHELAHVVQQGDGAPGESLSLARANDPAESAADTAAHQVLSNKQPTLQRGAGSKLLRLGANPGCTAGQAADIHQAIFNANSWVRKAVTKLAAAPLAPATLAALTHNFAASGTAANAASISAKLSAGGSDMNSIPYSCTNVAGNNLCTDHCGFSPVGGHASNICTNITLASTDAVFRAGCVLHEAMHASDATITAAADSYSGWFGHSSSTPGYPGATPLANADSYTTLAIELS